MISGYSSLTYACSDRGFWDDFVLQFGGRTLGHHWGNAPDVVVNRVVLEACVQAHNEGHILAAKGNAIIRGAYKWNPKLIAVCEVWKKIKFKFKSMHTLDEEKKKN
ncbi:hypothetical protein ACS0TY_028586 [Phlomoides rotata]